LVNFFNLRKSYEKNQLSYIISVKSLNNLSENRIIGKEFSSEFVKLLNKYKLSDEFSLKNKIKVG
jgi:hypothetical protein